VPVLEGACAAATWPEREQHLAHAYGLLAGRHNELGLTDPLDESTEQYFGRPYLVIRAGRFADALRGTLHGTEFVSLDPLGAVDQFVDSTDALTRPQLARALTAAAHPSLVGGQATASG
jgi:hypothetical protein